MSVASAIVAQAAVLPLAASPFIQIPTDALVWLHGLLGSWGWAIVALTIVIRVLILPLSIKQIRSMRELQSVQPQMKELQEKYKDDRQRMQRELMQLYQERGINPLASCLPLLLQMPFLILLFYTLRSDTFKNEVLDAPPVSFLFVESVIEKPIGAELIALIVLFVGTQMAATLVMSARTSTAGPQRFIMLGLPVIFAFFVPTFPAGLSVYWITTNIWTLGQQYVVTHVAPPPEAPPEQVATEKAKAKAPPPPPRKKKRRSGRRR